MTVAQAQFSFRTHLPITPRKEAPCSERLGKAHAKIVTVCEHTEESGRA